MVPGRPAVDAGGGSGGSSEASTPGSESVPARPPRVLPAAGLVTQLTEMGFSRKSVEYTIKVLGM